MIDEFKGTAKELKISSGCAFLFVPRWVGEKNYRDVIANIEDK